ncbi:MAG TPA: IS3 family transposase [Ktedonobacterales bacterium]|nr:IS3 family transposase [Ktedonobacterales bacterium]
MQFLVARGISERRACALVAANRATVQYHARPRANDGLSERLALLAEQHPRYGYRRVWALVRREGWRVNRKRVHRLWRVAQLQVPKRHRRRHRADGSASGAPTHATHPGHVWTYDFVQDACLGGAKLKLLPVVDEFTRECLAIEVATNAPAARVIRVLERLFALHGAPQYLRSDNGPEFIAQSIQDWLARHQTATLYIDPGCPWQNGFAESFNGSLRDECLNMQAFASVAEARIQIERFRREYNEERPHSRLGYRTPVEFKADWLADQSQESNTARS